MKDSFIEEKLNEFAEAVKSDGGRVLDAAVSELRKRKREGYYEELRPKKSGAKRFTRRLLAFGGTAAAIVLVFYFVISGFRSLFPSSPGNTTDPGQNQPGDPPDVDDPPRNTYNLRSLSYDVVPASEAAGRYSILSLTLENAYTNARLYYERTQRSPSVISILYRVDGAGGLEEIVIIADLNGGLLDYTNFWDFPKRTVAGVTVHSRAIMTNGECYTDMHFQYGEVDYYLRVASPVSESAYEYLNMLLYGY
jgi:hypothetical protein